MAINLAIFLCSLILLQETSSQSLQPPGAIQKDLGCGITKGCFSKCGDTNGTSCSFTVSWSEEAGSDPPLATYMFKSDIGASTGSYISIGFSTDSKMGDDDVIGCVGSSDGPGGLGSAFSSQNIGENTFLYTDANLTMVKGGVEDGILTCEIQRPVVSYHVDGYTRRDLLQKWTLLLALGPGTLDSNGAVNSLSNHGHKNRWSSGQAISLNDHIDIEATDEYPLIKVHGSLMIGAWVFFASIGMVIARYYKPIFSNTLFSQKQWFQIHRATMVLAFGACTAGFIIIFIEVRGWEEMKEKPEYLRAHPIMGIVVIYLCLINPILAPFRPHPNTQYRPIFNWAHWFVGNAAHILGVTTIFFGFEMKKAQAPSYLKYILAGYVAWQILVELALELMACGQKKDGQDTSMYQLVDSAADLTDDDNLIGTIQEIKITSTDTVERRKMILFAVHVVVVGAISAVLIVLLCK